MPYGISNKGGQSDSREVEAILRTAYRAGIRVIDTAARYGSSESVIGHSIGKKQKWRLITKPPFLQGEPDPVAKSSKAFQRSLKQLRQKRLYALLVDHSKDLLSSKGNSLFRYFQDLKASGLIQKIGVSVYTRKDIDAVLERYPIDLIQLPFNVLDQRLLKDGTLARLKDRGLEVHARSVFLQGLLLMSPSQIAKHQYFKKWLNPLREYHQAVKEKGIGLLQAALTFVLNQPLIDTVLVGTARLSELMEILRVSSRPASAIDYSRFGMDDEGLLNPSVWKIS
jgi:aryl-alcohol dehydrogenase-like predicted oxidoreductase